VCVCVCECVQKNMNMVCADCKHINSIVFVKMVNAQYKNMT
jgi:hypothetical protein